MRHRFMTVTCDYEGQNRRIAINFDRDYIAIYRSFWFISMGNLEMVPSFSITNGAVTYDEFLMYQRRLYVAARHPNLIKYKDLDLCLTK